MNKEIMDLLNTIKTDEVSFYDNDSLPKIKCSSPPNRYSSYHIRKKRILCPDSTSSDSKRYKTTNNSDFPQLVSSGSPSRSQGIPCDSPGPQDDGFLETIANFEPSTGNLTERFNYSIDNSNSFPQNIFIRTNSPGYFHSSFSSQNNSRTHSSQISSCSLQEDKIKNFGMTPSNSEMSPLRSEIAKISICVDSRTKSIFEDECFASEERIMSAVEKSEEEELIGDFSRTHSLSLVQGNHQDLKSITSNTLARLLKGEFHNFVDSYAVIDCRYPYEFNGGHIEGAINIYTKDQCLEIFNEQKSTPSSNEVHILIFYCEFSSERAPTLSRYLRQQDRIKNISSYPALQYPEIYLLEGGYKSFFNEYSTMCIPEAYTQMLHPKHEEDLRYFKSKSKTSDPNFRQKSHRVNLKHLLL